MNRPFARMARAVDNLAASIQEEVIVQTGYTDFPYRYANAFDFCTKEEMASYMKTADVVVLQGGWGSIREAMSARKRIVAMPRYNITEHIHDQFQLIHKLDSLGCVIGVFDECDLLKAVEKAKTYMFKQLSYGSVEALICNKLQEWFP